MNNLSEPTLWAIVLALASLVVWGGKYVLAKLKDCEDDRNLLHRKLGYLASVCSAKVGEVIDLDHIR